MLNLVNYVNIINSPDPAGSLDFVNPPDLIIPHNSMDLPDFTQGFYSINGSYLIKGFDQIRQISSIKFQKRRDLTLSGN